MRPSIPARWDTRFLCRVEASGLAWSGRSIVWQSMADTATVPVAERTLPHNLEAERSVLGAILIHNDAFNVAAELIDAGDFFRDAHRRVFDTMVSLNERGQAIDLVTLKDELGRSGDLDDVGGRRVYRRSGRRCTPFDQC